MDPLNIEDTTDWLGCPTELETVTHYNRLLENEVQELTLKLRKAREDIFGLTKMLADAERPLEEISGDTGNERCRSGGKRKEISEQTRSRLPPAEAC